MKKITIFLRNLFYKIIYKNPSVLSDEETIDYIIKNNCSIARYGDGEISLMNNNDIKIFQKFNPLLKKRLIEIANCNNLKVLICIPEIISKKHKCELTEGAIKFWNRHIFFFGGYYNKYFNKQNVLGDATLSRFYLGVVNRERIGEYIKKLKLIWNKKRILIVEGYNTKTGIGNDLFDNALGIRRILCPNSNAFDCYDEIIKSIINLIDDELVICALGPTATILAYDLQAKYNIQTLDLGHIDIEYMWYLNNSDGREKVIGKNTAEYDNEVFDEKNLTPGTIKVIKK